MWDAAMGYTILAMRDAGFSTNDIKRVLNSMLSEFNLIDAEKAANVFDGFRVSEPFDSKGNFIVE